MDRSPRHQPPSALPSGVAFIHVHISTLKYYPVSTHRHSLRSCELRHLSFDHVDSATSAPRGEHTHTCCVFCMFCSFSSFTSRARRPVDSEVIDRSARGSFLRSRPPPIPISLITAAHPIGGATKRDRPISPPAACRPRPSGRSYPSYRPRELCMQPLSL